MKCIKLQSCKHSKYVISNIVSYYFIEQYIHVKSNAWNVMEGNDILNILTWTNSYTLHIEKNISYHGHIEE